MSETYNLYSTDGCHLCEQALELIHSLDPSLKITVLDIIDNPKWLEDFQIRIPVLERVSNKAHLDWPFDSQALVSFLNTYA